MTATRRQEPDKRNLSGTRPHAKKSPRGFGEKNGKKLPMASNNTCPWSLYKHSVQAECIESKIRCWPLVVALLVFPKWWGLGTSKRTNPNNGLVPRQHRIRSSLNPFCVRRNSSSVFRRRVQWRKPFPSVQNKRLMQRRVRFSATAEVRK